MILQWEDFITKEGIKCLRAKRSNPSKTYIYIQQYGAKYKVFDNPNYFISGFGTLLETSSLQEIKDMYQSEENFGIREGYYRDGDKS